MGVAWCSQNCSFVQGTGGQGCLHPAQGHCSAKGTAGASQALLPSLSTCCLWGKLGWTGRAGNSSLANTSSSSCQPVLLQAGGLLGEKPTINDHT